MPLRCPRSRPQHVLRVDNADVAAEAGSDLRSSRLCCFAAGHPWLDGFKWVAIAAVAVGLPTILLRAFGGLRRGLLDINTLMTVAVAGA